MKNHNVIKIGAVVYAPSVVVVWDIMSKFFEEEKHPIECIYYKTYEEQIDSFMNKEIDIAWNSPLAHIDAKRRTNNKCIGIAMRDTDRDRRAHFVVNKDSNFKKLQDLQGKTIGFGAIDSPQARLIPIVYLHNEGLHYNKDYIEKTFDLDVGLHGDHIGGEIEAVKSLQEGNLDAAIVSDFNWDSWKKDGTVDGNQFISLDRTTPYDHCIFTVYPDFDKNILENWVNTLYKMDYNIPEHKKMMDLEGLKQWLPGRESGFNQLEQAVELLKFFER